MPHPQNDKKLHKKLDKALAKKPKKKPLISGAWKAFLFAFFCLVLAFADMQLNGVTNWTWLFFILGALIILPNLAWLKRGWASNFGLPYLLVMFKTKKFIKTIYSLSHHGKFLERMSTVGMILGFGLVAVDYLKARSLGGWKRILLLIIAAICLIIFFYVFLAILFSVPALAPILLVGLISFVLLGLGGLSLGLLLGYGGLSVIAALTAKQICPSIAPVIPGVPIPGLGVVVPLIAWISLGIILVVHEMSHGVLLAHYKQKIKSVGLLLVGFFPMGAFVEQDDKQFNKIEDRKALMVLSGGPSSNLLTIPITLALLLLFSFSLTPVVPFFENQFNLMYEGVKVGAVQKEVSYCGITAPAPAYGKLLAGDKVLFVNGIDINSITTLAQINKNSSDLNFLVLRGDQNISLQITPYLFEDLNIKQIGAEFAAIPTGYEPPIWVVPAQIVISGINSILFFLALLSFAVGMFNFMPSDPLDGGRMGKILMRPYFGFLKFSKKDTEKFIGRLFAWLFVLSLLVNLLPYVTMVF